MQNITDFTGWKLDRDIPSSIWNSYLRKYKQEYKVFEGEEGTLKIKCKFGEIEPYSLIKGILCFYGKFPTPNKKSRFLRKIRGLRLEITQEGEDECIVKFRESSLVDFIGLFQVKQRIKLSNEEHERRSKSMIQVRKKLLKG